MVECRKMMPQNVRLLFPCVILLFLICTRLVARQSLRTVFFLTARSLISMPSLPERTCLSFATEHYAGQF